MSDRLRMIESLLERGSDDPFHFYARAMELRSLERLEEAQGAFMELRERFPDYVPTYLMAAQVALELDRDEDAKELGEAGVEAARRAGDSHAAREIEQLLATLP